MSEQLPNGDWKQEGLTRTPALTLTLTLTLPNGDSKQEGLTLTPALTLTLTFTLLPILYLNPNPTPKLIPYPSPSH